MNVIRVRTAGFCMGVGLALRKLDQALKEHPDTGEGRLVMLGPIIHNPQVLDAYTRLGVVCAHSLADVRPGDTVVIRAHGIPRDDEARLVGLGARVLDATCPRVKQAQLSIDEATRPGTSLYLFGEAEHPEVRGLVSYANSPCAVFGSLGELEAMQTFREEQDVVLAALLDMGFDDVYEVAKAAELVSDATRRILQTGSIERPVISSACPAVTRLIRVRFPQLIDHVLPLVAPIELAARLAKKEAVRRTGLPKEDIGCIFITPCPAKVTAIHSPIGSSRSEVESSTVCREKFLKPHSSRRRLSRTAIIPSLLRVGKRMHP